MIKANNYSLNISLYVQIDVAFGVSDDDRSLEENYREWKSVAMKARESYKLLNSMMEVQNGKVQI